MTTVVTVAGLKGGVGKTTTAIHLSVALAGLTEERILILDADPQGSALSWSEQAEGFSNVNVVSLPVKDLHRRAAELGTGYGWVVIDTPPGDLAIAASAIRAADELVLPLPPSTIDVDRLRPTLEMIAELDPLRAEPISPRVLLTRVRANTLAAKAVREVLEGLGLDVLTAQIPLREQYSTAFGSPVNDPGEYAAVATELLGIPAAQQ